MLKIHSEIETKLLPVENELVTGKSLNYASLSLLRGSKSMISLSLGSRRKKVASKSKETITIKPAAKWRRKAKKAMHILQTVLH